MPINYGDGMDTERSLRPSWRIEGEVGRRAREGSRANSGGGEIAACPARTIGRETTHVPLESSGRGVARHEPLVIYPGIPLKIWPPRRSAVISGNPAPSAPFRRSGQAAKVFHPAGMRGKLLICETFGLPFGD